MKVLNKIKGWFVEEYEDDEEDEEQEEVVEREQLARKVEVPKPSFRDRFKNKKVDDDEEDEEEEETTSSEPVEVQPVEVSVPRENRIVNLVEEEEETEVYEPVEVKEEAPIQEEEEEEFPSRSTRVPLVFEDDNLFPEVEEHEEEPVDVPYEKPLYQGKKESTYVESMKNSNYLKVATEVPKGTKFKPSPIISPIYGILDKNYKKEEIVTRKDKTSESEYRDSSIDKVRKKAFGENKKEEKDKEEPVKEKKVNVNNGKPGVSSVTIADADEYYNDLGLAYNEDYKDMSRVNSNKKKEETKKKDKDDDNLFDLIDSMYKKED